MIGDTGKFKVQELLSDKDGFAVVSGYWDGGTDLRLACRWHDPQNPNDLGYPQTFGKPQWMLLPPNTEARCDNLLLPCDKRTIILTLKG